MTMTTSEVPTETVSVVVRDYNSFIMRMLGDELSPADVLQFKALLQMAGLGFVAARAAAELAAVFGDPDDTGDQPGT